MNFFKPTDFQCKCCGVDGTTQEAKDRLVTFREAVGIPMPITSAYRCEKHNTAVGGAKSSQHMLGAAFDVKWDHLSGAQKSKMLRLAFSHWVGIGLHKSFLHVDRRKGDQIVWFY